MKNFAKIGLISSIFWQVILFLKLDHFIWDVGLVVPWFISKGLIPYRDFDGGPYFPIPKFLMLLILPIFNWNPEVTIYLALVEAFIVLIILYFMSKSFLKGYWQLLPFLYFSVWHGYILGPTTFDTNIFIGILLLLSMFIYTKILEKSTKTKALILGLVSGLSFFSQQMSAIPIVIIFISLVLYLRLKKNTIKELFRVFILPYCLGFAVPAAYLFLWFFRRGALSFFLDETVLYYMDPSRYPFTKLGHSATDIVTLLVLTMPLLFVVFALRSVKDKKIKWFLVTGFIVIVFTTISILFAVLHPRRYLFTLPIISFLTVYSASLLNYKKRLLKIIAVIIIGIFGIYFFQNILPAYLKSFAKVKAYQTYNEPHPGDGDYEAIHWILDNTKSDAEVQIMGPMLYYFETQRMPASSKTYSGLPWTYEPFEKTKIMWQNNKADYWLVDEGLFRRYKEWGYDYQGIFIREFLDNNYTKVETFKTMSIYQLKNEKN